MSRIIRAVPVVACLAAIVAASAAAAPRPATGRAAEPIEARLPVSATNLVCPPSPALSEAAAGAGVDAGFAAQPVKPIVALTALTFSDSTTARALSARTVPDDGEASELKPSTSGPISLLTTKPGDPVSLAAQPSSGTATAIGALTSTLTTAGDLSGLAISSCTAVSSQGWLNGGALTVGRTSRVVLSNPGRSASSVSLSVLTAAGRSAPAGGEDIVVPGGKTREVLVSALVEGTGPTVIGFRTQGAPIAASLVDSDLAGVTPRGVEQVQPSDATTQAVLAPLTKVYGSVALRLANPANRPVKVTWRALGADGPLGDSGEEKTTATLAPGAVQEFGVDLPDDATGLQVNAAKPVLASAIVTREREGEVGKPADYAVLTPGTPMTGSSLVAAAPGTSRVGLVAGDQPATVQVRGLAADGKAVVADQTVAVPAGAAKILEVPDGVTAMQLAVRGGQVRGGEIVVAGDQREFLAGTQIVPAPAVQHSVQVELGE